MTMNEVRREIARLEAAIALYDRHIPSAEGKWLERLRHHRNWDLSIIADLRRFAGA
jgi:hypothetical protein